MTFRIELQIGEGPFVAQEPQVRLPSGATARRLALGRLFPSAQPREPALLALHRALAHLEWLHDAAWKLDSDLRIEALPRLRSVRHLVMRWMHAPVGYEIPTGELEALAPLVVQDARRPAAKPRPMTLAQRQDLAFGRALETLLAAAPNQTPGSALRYRRVRGFFSRLLDQLSDGMERSPEWCARARLALELEIQRCSDDDDDGDEEE